MAKSSKEDRIEVFKGMVTAAILTGCIYFTGYYVFPSKSYQFHAMADKLAFTIRWQTFPVLTFMFGIMVIANKRFFTAAIDPLSRKGEQNLAIDQQYLQNTFEQLVLSISGQVILTTYLTDSLSRVIPMLVILFVTGRVLFWYGYHRNPLKRAIGFGITFYPSVIMHLTNAFYFVYYRHLGFEIN